MKIVLNKKKYFGGSMKALVTDKGVIIPPEFFTGIKEVEIFYEHSRIIISPISKDDPIYELGKNPIIKLAGIVENGHLTKNIDEELYGEI